MQRDRWLRSLGDFGPRSVGSPSSTGSSGLPYNAIEVRHGERAIIDIFPALPTSAAVAVGRVWTPKADLPLVIYDRNWTLNGFLQALEIGAPTSNEVIAMRCVDEFGRFPGEDVKQNQTRIDRRESRVDTDQEVPPASRSWAAASPSSICSVASRA